VGPGAVALNLGAPRRADLTTEGDPHAHDLPWPLVPAARGDEAHLFRTHHRRPQGLVERAVSARPQVIEDGCAFAWLELIARQPARTNIIGWLRVVARREAVRLARHDRRATRLAQRASTVAPARPAAEAVAAHEALSLVARLPVRKRAVLALQVAGHSYAEIADRLQMTHRTVERQLLRVGAGVRSAQREALPAADRR
jgi:RNA polymerase sigma factor (sigma-70 family)